MWFRWEHDHSGWGPVVYHGHTGDSKWIRQTTAIQVPDDCIGPDGSPMFGRLQERFPKPVEATE